MESRHKNGDGTMVPFGNFTELWKITFEWGKSSSIIYKLAIVSVKSTEGILNGHFDNDKPLDGIGSPMFRKT
jgi:hypothetical protein